MRDFLCKDGALLPDVVLLDVGMDNLNGDVAMQEIRKAGCKVCNKTVFASFRFARLCFPRTSDIYLDDRPKLFSTPRGL